jgi:hypothetical protein
VTCRSFAHLSIKITATATFKKVKRDIPELADAAFHGLRGTRVVELRRRGLSTAQIQDVVGMSLTMIERYCRFADKKANAMATFIHMGRKQKKDTAL